MKSSIATLIVPATLLSVSLVQAKDTYREVSLTLKKPLTLNRTAIATDFSSDSAKERFKLVDQANEKLRGLDDAYIDLYTSHEADIAVKGKIYTHEDISKMTSEQLKSLFSGTYCKIFGANLYEIETSWSWRNFEFEITQMQMPSDIRATNIHGPLNEGTLVRKTGDTIEEFYQLVSRTYELNTPDGRGTAKCYTVFQGADQFDEAQKYGDEEYGPLKEALGAK